MIALPNLAIGNFASVLRMVEKAGETGRLVSSPADLRKADRIILAGVGAFDNGMSSLQASGWVDELHEAVLHRRVPILGICLGMQLMCATSEEGALSGLGWMNAEVVRLRVPSESGLKVPHMGWNTVEVAKPNGLIDSQAGEQRFYFVHSYHVVCQAPDDVLATAHHGQEITAAISRDNIYGVQFHPEKSHRFGMSVMKRFLEL